MNSTDKLFTVNIICRNCHSRKVDVKFEDDKIVYQGKHAGVKTTRPALRLECDKCDSVDWFIIF